MSEPVRQHIVPRFLLDRWTKTGQDTLYVYDKEKDRVFPASPKDVAVQKSFYTDPGSDHELERRLANLEGNIKPILDEIVERDSASRIVGDRKSTLDLFLSVQMERTENVRIRMDQLARTIMATYGAHMVEDLREDVLGTDPAEVHRDIVKSAGTLLKSFSRLRLGLHVNQTDYALTISDNPVTLSNPIPPSEPWRGNLGLECLGIHVYLPISPNHALVAMDPDIFPTSPWGIKMLQTRGWIRDLSEVVWFRAEQCASSVRFIYSRENDFEFERWMVERHPELADPDRPRLTMVKDVDEDEWNQEDDPFDQWVGLLED